MAEIILDKKTFEALAVDTRVDILKALKKRRKTQSELSKEMHLAVSTVAEHLTKMEKASLVEKKEQGKKWIYFELTEKGRAVVSPEQAYKPIFAFALLIFFAVIIIGFYAASQQTPTGSDDYLPVAGKTEGSAVQKLISYVPTSPDSDAEMNYTGNETNRTNSS